MVTNFIRRFYLILFVLRYIVKNLDLNCSSFFVNDKIKVFVFKDKIGISEDPTKLICYLFDEIFTRKFILKIQSLNLKIHQYEQERNEIKWAIGTNIVSIYKKGRSIFEEDLQTLLIIKKVCNLFENNYNWDLVKNCVERWKQFVVRQKSRKRFYKLLKVVSEHLGNPRFIHFENKMLD